jgi:TonB family protein
LFLPILPFFHHSNLPIFLTMKHFLPISILLHAVVLLLLFSWEIPLADRLLPGSIVEVSLIERIEGKPEGKKEGGDEKKRRTPPIKQRNIQEKKNVGAARHVPGVIARPEEDLKVDEPKPKKVEPVQKEIREEKAKTEGQMRAEPPVLTAISEGFPVLMARLTPPAGGIAETRESPIPLKASPAFGGRGDGGGGFLPSAEPQSGQEGIALGGGGKGSGAGLGEGGTSRFSRVRGSSGDEDSVIAEIIRRIEKAKRYPRMARKMGVEGQATVRFKLKGNGRIEKAELLETSGSEILDRASLETVQRAAPLPYKEGWLKVVIVFKIL